METTEGLLNRLKTDADTGLTPQQVQENRLRYGANTLTRSQPETLFGRIRDAVTEPMIIMLIIAWLIALSVNIYESLTGGEADLLECTGILVAIVLSVSISVFMEGKSARAFETLSRISDDIIIRVIRSGETVRLHQSDIVAGDILLLATGDRIPADCRLIEAASLAVDESALTGESVPAEKDPARASDDDTPMAERADTLYGGTYITSGHCKAVVTATGDATEFGQIAANSTRPAKPPPLFRKNSRGWAKSSPSSASSPPPSSSPPRSSPSPGTATCASKTSWKPSSPASS